MTLCGAWLVLAARAVAQEVELTDQAPSAGGELAAEVAKALDTYTLYDVFDWIEASVERGRVKLEGVVYQAWRRDMVEKRIEQVPGVVGVDNLLRVLPVSSSDEFIRVEAVRLIYGDFRFLRYAGTAHPPIHIVVENGHLTLEGRVGSRDEKKAAEKLVRRGTIATKVTNHLRVEAAARQGR